MINSFYNHPIASCDARANMANSDLSIRLDHFATLASRLDFKIVAPIPLQCHSCHNIHTLESNDPKNLSIPQNCKRNNALLSWLTIVFNEGHVEPSQPEIGRATGWPCRPMLTKSLWVDFICWCLKQKVHEKDQPLQNEFYDTLSHFFTKNGDSYEFPSLDVCKKNFALFKEIKNEYN